MRARVAMAGGVVVLAGCTGPLAAPSPPITAPATNPATASAVTPSATRTGPAPTSGGTPSASSTPTGRPVLTLSGTVIADRPLGGVPLARLEPLLVARLGKARVGRTQLCRLAGERSQVAVIDHSFGGLTVHYGRRGTATLAMAWTVHLDRVPAGFQLADRLPWRPAFAELEADGVAVSTGSGLRTARLEGRAITYSGDAGATRPDTVEGGPELTCR